jgi:hypothetical protein
MKDILARATDMGSASTPPAIDRSVSTTIFYAFVLCSGYRVVFWFMVGVFVSFAVYFFFLSVSPV